MQSPQNSGLSSENQSKGNCVLNPRGKSAMVWAIRFEKEPMDKASLSALQASWYPPQWLWSKIRAWLTALAEILLTCPSKWQRRTINVRISGLGRELKLNLQHFNCTCNTQLTELLQTATEIGSQLLVTDIFPHRPSVCGRLWCVKCQGKKKEKERRKSSFHVRCCDWHLMLRHELLKQRVCEMTVCWVSTARAYTLTQWGRTRAPKWL